MVDRDVSLRKAIDKLCDFTVSLKVEQRDTVASLLDGHDVLFSKSLLQRPKWNESDFKRR